MIRSMTGYGEAAQEFGGVHFFLEIRSLNSKYLKTVIRLPEQFQGLEAEIEAELRQMVTRGTVTVTGTSADASEGAAFEVNQRALERYIEQIRQVPMVAQGHANIDVGSLLTLPGVLQPPGNEEARIEAARAAFLTLLRRACDVMIAMREKEGRSLHEELSRQRDLMRERLEGVSGRAPAVGEEYARRLRARIDAMLQQAEIKVEPVELIKEIAVYAERTDINEEISRLAGHLDQFSELLEADGKPVGRTLDFLTQEMLREANTIASKSPDSQISRAIIEVKGAIDRIKELVQNVE